MVDKKTQFMLSLQGKHYDGHMEYWTTVEGDLTGLIDGRYILAARGNSFKLVDGEYAVINHKDIYYTLGNKCTHEVMVEVYSGAAKGKYDPDDGMGHEPYKCWD